MSHLKSSDRSSPSGSPSRRRLRQEGRAAPPAGPVEVGVVTLAPTPVTLTKELPGRTSAFRVAEVRARVNGIVQKRLFTEGSDVKEGQPLFRIDPAPYQAALDGAKAQLARAEATLATRACRRSATPSWSPTTR